MKAVAIMDDEETLENITQACHICWPDAELVSTNLGQKGIELVETESPDIVFLDLGLPDINGFDVLKQIRCYSQVPMIVLSFLRDETAIVKSLALGADEYLVKPVGQLEFVAHVRALLRKSNS